MKENIEELKRLLYTDTLTQCGKRKLINYYEKEIRQLQKEKEDWEKAYQEENDKQFDLLKEILKLQEENEELKEKWDKDTHKLQNDLDIANAEIIELKADRYELNNRVVDLLDNIPVQKVKDILNEINKEYIKQEEIFNKHFEKEERDIQDYYIQKEATNIMQELSWVEGKLQDLLEEKGE